ncbi:hypothetical protein [Ferrovibrio sp.]|uniref:hypothetical protein n=1 Tax=Ferrovibrio sp. TaxID=1917215 RepID=UPI00311E2205
MKLVNLERRPDPDAVEAAREILRQAEAGEIIEITCAAYRPDGHLMTWITGTNDQLRRLGALSRLLHRCNLLADQVTS